MHLSSRRHARRPILAAAIAATAAVTLSACAVTPAATRSTAEPEAAAASAGQRLALTYEGGLLVLDAKSLDVLADLPLDGFNRLNTAGDGEHVFVSTEGGFRVLATGADGSEPELTDLAFAAQTPGHVVRHEGRTVLFDDATGTITAFDTDALGDATDMPETATLESEQAHHGVAVELSDGTVVSTLGDSETRAGVRVLDAEGIELDRFEQCPGVHGEGVAADEAVIVGCADGVLVYRDGAFTKLDSPDEFGGVGTAYATGTSPIAVVDYNPDPDAEGVLVSQVGFVDTAENTFDVAALPEGVQYSWRGVGRDASDDAWLLGTDGALHKFDPETREIVESIDVIEAWEGPAEWQQAHPALIVAGDIAYVTEPASNEVHRVDLGSGEVVQSASLGTPTTEIALVD